MGYTPRKRRETWEERMDRYLSWSLVVMALFFMAFWVMINITVPVQGGM